MRVLPTVVVAALLSIPASGAEVRVEIISMPSEVFSFEPAYVLFSVENLGSESTMLPHFGAPDYGPGLYVGYEDEKPGPPQGIIADTFVSYSPQSMWLGPGERWLFYMVARLGARPGEYSVQAVFSSAGRCGEKIVAGRHLAPLTSVRSEPAEVPFFSSRVYHCWSGEARSGVRRIRVRLPESAVDREAAGFLVAARSLEVDRNGEMRSLIAAWPAAKSFPTSHYAYAALTLDPTGAGQMQEALRLQPDNPLNPWVNGAFAQRVLDYRSSCWSGQKVEWDVAIDKLELPPGVREYLDQYAWTLEKRTCPLERERLAKEKARKGSTPGRR